VKLATYSGFEVRKSGSLRHPTLHFDSGIIRCDGDHKHFENVLFSNYTLVKMKKSEDRACRYGSLFIVQMAAENRSLAVENGGVYYKSVTSYR
jgi:hypothetical protein